VFVNIYPHMLQFYVQGIHYKLQNGNFP